MGTRKKKKEQEDITPVEQQLLDYAETQVSRLSGIKYIDGDINKGIKINWKEVFECYKKLGCPKTVYDPSELPIEKAAWFVLTSERSTGKTTNLILIAMILALKYGCVSAYIRQMPKDISPKEMQNFLSVVTANHYVEKLTGGDYNGVRYWARYYRFVKWAADGSKEKESEPFLWVGCLAEELNYKSILNLPTCQMIIYDEFITDMYLPNEFVSLNNLHKTIGRKRKEIKLFLCSNTINYYHEYFKELLIQDEVLECKINESFIKKTELGTCVYYKWIGDKDPEREQLNTEYYGFNNPLLRSITGGDWAVRGYPHIMREDREVLDDKHFITYLGRYFQIELVTSERLGLHVIVHKANEPEQKRQCFIYTIDEIRDKREKYCYGKTKLDKLLWNLYNDNKWYYSNNDIGFSVQSYVNRADKL